MAQRLPDDFLTLEGGAAERAAQLIARNWAGHEAKPKAQLAEALLPIVSKLLEPGVSVNQDDRDLCEGLVAAWLFRQS